MNDCTPDSKNIFSKHGMRCTRQRAAVYAEIAGRQDHPTADDIYQSIKSEESNVSLATIYNTLETFCAAGLIQKLPGVGDNGSSRYDATTKQHLHLRCKKSGKVEDVPHKIGKAFLDNMCPKDIAKLEDKLGFKINQVQVELVGEYK